LPLRRLLASILQLELPLLALWIALAWALSSLTTRVVDWYVMTDELLYERLALSVAEHASLLPRVHGELVPNVNQLYPVLLAPAFRDGLVSGSLHDAHALNAWVMSSACVPAFFLARRVTGRRLVAYAVALLAVCVPWIVLSSFLLTEVVGYPAFLWAMLALQRATAAPSRGNDLLLLAALALAVVARTQFVVLLVVAPVVVLAHELAAAQGNLRATARRAVRSHPILAAASAALVAFALVAASVGRLSDVLGTYASTLGGNLLPNGFGRSFAEHSAALALGLGILPFLVGAAWLLANLVRPPVKELHAFACVGSLTITAILVEVTVFDLRFGTGAPRDRYLFYVVPLVLVAFACALLDRRWPLWSLVAPTVLVGIGFALSPVPVFGRLNVDTPVAVLNDYLLSSAGSVDAARALLVGATVVLVVLFVQGAALLPRALLAATLAALTLVALPLETAYAFARLFRYDGTAGRPLTLDQGGVLNWIDRRVGTARDVTIVPYPSLPGEYWSSVAYWWDVEFWNKSISRALHVPREFEWTPSSFPKLSPRFDQATGVASTSPTRYVVQSTKETRFRIAGPIASASRDAVVIDAGPRWRADWVSHGLYSDGWTKPGTPAVVRVFAVPGQKHALTRTLTFGIRAPLDDLERPFRIGSNLERVRGRTASPATLFQPVRVCVPRKGWADVTFRTPEVSTVYGDMRSESAVTEPRLAGLLLVEVALADELGPPCRPTSS
jgi:hypothetical protein